MMKFLSTAHAMARVQWQRMTLRARLDPEQVDLRFCYDVLRDVSRSFAMVILQLRDESLRDAICIFYLVLRALDTLEDDMRVPTEVKLRELPRFHTHLRDPTWCLAGVGTGRERELLEDFARVSREFARLPKSYQLTISDICEQMAHGMCDFLQRPVVTRADYDLYCHYVAGLVGHGLTRLFASCGFEDPSLAADLTWANHMGLFLQKTNIIRDYYEDLREEPPRMFWPREIWGPYAETLSAFTETSHEVEGVKCLNAMVADALVHVSPAVEYLTALRDPSVFKFCAIPQVMAMATLAEVYNNPDVFHRKVKISKASACCIVANCNNLYHALGMFGEYGRRLHDRLDPEDPSTPSIRELLEPALELVERYKQAQAPVPHIRSLMAHYPGLGGRFLLTMVDNISGFFSQRL